MDEKTFHYKLKKIHFLDFLGLNYIKNCGCFFPKIPRFSNTKKANRHTVRSNNRLINYINFVKILYFYAR